jgi:hypothetical protein
MIRIDLIIVAEGLNHFFMWSIWFIVAEIVGHGEPCLGMLQPCQPPISTVFALYAVDENDVEDSGDPVMTGQCALPEL